MVEEPIVSFIIPTFNEAKTIRTVLNELFKNDYPTDKIDVVVCDSCSTDSTVAVCESMMKQYPITLIKEFKGNKAEARNACLHKTTGDFIFNYNAHVLPDRDLLKTVVSKFSDDVDIVGVSNEAPIKTIFDVWLDESLQGFMAGSGTDVFTQYEGTNVDRYVKHVPFCCYKREVFNVVGEFDSKFQFGQDAEFNHRCINAGYRILFTGDTSVSQYRPKNIGLFAKKMYNYGVARRMITMKHKDARSIYYFLPEFFMYSVIIIPVLMVLGRFPPWAFVFGASTYVILCLVSYTHVVSPSIYFILHFSYGFGLARGRFLETRIYCRKKDTNTQTK